MPSRADINGQRASLIAQALDTPEGRSALAQAMVEPIRRGLEYQGIGRQLLMVDELVAESNYVKYTRYEDTLYDWLVFYHFLFGKKAHEEKWALPIERL